MNFSEKVVAIDEARKAYPAFNQEFIDYLGLGYSFNGAYNHFTLEDINKYAPKTIAAPSVPKEVKTVTPKTTASKPATK